MNIAVLQTTHPLEDIFIKGQYGRINEYHRAAYTLRIIDNFSICRVIPTAHDHTSLFHHIRSLLGVTMPVPGDASIAGTRMVLHPIENTYFLVTEGESDGALFSRLSSRIHEQAVILNHSHGYCVIRIDGLEIGPLLQAGTMHKDLSPAEFPVGKTALVMFGDTQILLHAFEIDRWLLYIQRSYARCFFQWLARICLPHGLALA